MIQILSKLIIYHFLITILNFNLILSSSEIISYSQMRDCFHIAFRDFLELCIAIHCMPEGFLWSAKLNNYQVGLLGTVSSFCVIYKNV